MFLSLTPRRLLLVTLCVAAAILAVIRYSQIEIERPATELNFVELNALRWDSSHGTLEPTGDDPHAFLDLPAASVPLTGLVMEFSGPLPPGSSYLYTSPAHFPGIDISDKTAVMGAVEPIVGGFRLRFTLPPSRAIRFDLPDALHTGFVLRKATFQTHFVGSSNPVFALFAATAGAALLLFAWTLLGSVVTRHRGLQFACIAVLIGAKLWLAADLHQTIFPYAMHDDALFLSQGHSIANGDWLGTFGELTLSKGPTFPIFIALVQLTRIPFLEAEAGFHALACLVFLLALWPVVRSAGLRLSLFALLLFDPHTLSIQVVAQVLRSGIQPALTLFALAGFIGLLVRVAGPPLRLLPWAALAGVAFSLFWFSREEGIWLAPSVGLLAGTALWLAWRAGRSGRVARFGFLLLPFAMWVGAQNLLRAVNHHYYGEWATIDVKDAGFPDAYAALTRITPAETIPGVPITKETRLRAYAVSPALAELKPFLEGPSGDNWASRGWEGSKSPYAQKEIRGWFQWALRQAAREAGHYQNAATASAYWHRVADELNAACDDGRLAAGPRRSGFAPRWEASLWPVFGRSLGAAVAVVVQFVDFSPQSTPSAGDPERIAFFSRMLHEEPVMERLPPTPRTHVSILLFHIYSMVGEIASVLALGALAALVVQAWRRRDQLVELALLFALAGGSLSLIVIVALVDATSFSTTHAIYLSPATPLALATWILAPVWAAQAWRLSFPSISLAVANLSTIRRWRVFGLMRPSTTGAVFFCLLAVAFGVVRWQQTTTVIPGHEVVFSMVHDMQWDETSRQLTRTGPDPFGSLDLPLTALPVRDVSIDFKGEFADVQGHFYAFQYPAHLPGWGTDGNTMTDGQVTRHGGEFNVHWVLQDTKVVRIDLPDFLDHPVELKELRLKTTFAWSGSTPFRLMWLSLLAAALCLAWRASRGGPNRRRWIGAAVGVALIALKLSVASDLPLSVYGSAAHDDALFVGQADAILHGQWLGDFNEITLAKGPVYSLFLALVGASGVRLETAQTGLHALACVAFVAAVRPLVSSPILRLLLLAVLLFDPHTLSAEVVGRPLRSGLQPALTLLTLAGFIGLAARITESPRRLIAWSLLAGVAGSAFWFCREEGLWLLPSVSVILAAATVVLFRATAGSRWLRLGCLALPVGIWFASTWTLRLLNSHFYGAPLTMDVKDGNYARAYGALMRITPATSIPLVPVTKETRLRAYAVSPAFKELQPLLEGALGDGWSQPGWEGSNHPSARKEMRGWFQWALRQAAAQAGHYRSARTADEYWGRVADEINAACDRGDLAAGPARSGFYPHWDSSLWPALCSAWWRAFQVTAQFAGFGLHLAPSEATPEQFALFRRITHEFPSDGRPAATLAQQARLQISRVYNSCGAWLSIAAAAATASLGVQTIRHHRQVVEFSALLALLGGAFALILVVALVDTTAFTAVNGSYLSPASPLALAAWVLAPTWAWLALKPAARTAGP